MTLVSTTPDEAKQAALLRAVGLDRVAPEQRELAIGIANRYDLDLMLKHLVMIEGRPYITRDGLLHIAHKSHQFDGMETTDPVLGEDGYWRSTASVFRKDMSRPFTYTGRYPAQGKNRAYAPEMAIKVGEVMALRRAFDVAAPVVEERWTEDDPETADTPEPTSLAERIAARAESIQTPEPSAPAQSTETDPEPEPEAGVEPPAPEPEAAESPVVAAAQAAADAGGGPAEVLDAAMAAEPVSPLRDEDDDGPTLDEFAELVKDLDKNVVKSTAKRLYPDLKQFKDLSRAQLGRLVDELAIQPQPGGIDEARFGEVGPQEAASPEPPSVANGGIALCGEPSPYGSGNTCSQDAGHPKSVPHRSGLKETW